MVKGKKPRSVLFDGSPNVIGPPNLFNTRSQTTKSFSFFGDSPSIFNTPNSDISSSKNPKTSKDNTQKRDKECRLTESQKRNIRNIINKCEYCRGIAQDIHHIKPCEKGGTNAYSNIIVLCKTCHGLAHGQGGMISQNELKKRLSSRNKAVADQVREYLKMKNIN